MGKCKQNSVKQSACLDMEDIRVVWLASVDCLFRAAQSLVWLVNVSTISLSFYSFHSFSLLLWVGEALPCVLIFFFSLRLSGVFLAGVCNLGCISGLVCSCCWFLINSKSREKFTMERSLCLKWGHAPCISSLTNRNHGCGILMPWPSFHWELLNKKCKIAWICELLIHRTDYTCYKERIGACKAPDTRRVLWKKLQKAAGQDKGFKGPPKKLCPECWNITLARLALNDEKLMNVSQIVWAFWACNLMLFLQIHKKSFCLLWL